MSSKLYIKKNNKYFKYYKICFKKKVENTNLNPNRTLPGVARFLIIFLSIINYCYS